MRAPRVPPAGEHGVVLAEVPGVLDVLDRHPGGRHELAADLGGPVGAAVVDENDLMAAVHLEPLDVAHEGLDGGGTVVQRNDEAQRWGHYGSLLWLGPQSHAAPRTPLLSPKRAWTRRVRGASPPKGRSSGGTFA